MGKMCVWTLMMNKNEHTGGSCWVYELKLKIIPNRYIRKILS